MVRCWLQLSLTDGIGPVLAHRIIEAAAGDIGVTSTDSRAIQHAVSAGPALLRKADGIGRNADALAAAMAKAADEAGRELERVAKAGVRVICPADDEYPALLKSVPGPPLVLYVRGGFEDRDLHSLGIVGSRKCSHYGREMAERLSASAAGVGVTIISGGARGIDSSAHRGALSHPHGRTIAVLGCGVDMVYPPENGDLFNQIAQDGRGAVVSEYPMATPPLADNFPRRNRIISALSRAVLVVEADERSGALITARYAGVEHGRPVLALPGRIDNPLSAGPHALIRDGATLVSNIGDILEALGPLPEQAVSPGLFDSPDPVPPVTSKDAGQPTFYLTPRQQVIVGAITEESSVEQIIDRTGLEAGIVLQELTVLSIRGVVKRLQGQVFSRRKG